MDGFALPPFESTCIFRDKDIIRVKQKSCKNIVHHNAVHCIQEPEIVEKRPLPTDEKILAIEYQMDCGKHQEEVHCEYQSEENATSNQDTSSKRKQRDGDAGRPESLKRKKLKVTTPDNVCQDRVHCSSNNSKPSTIDAEAKKGASQAEGIVRLDEKQKTDRCNQTMLNCVTEVAVQTTQSDKVSCQSRSARRKKLKRQLKKKAKEELKENGHCQEPPIAADCPPSSNQDDLCPSSNQKDPHLPFSSHEAEAEEEESETADDIVPVVVRPGHIRFEPAGERSTSSAKEIQGTFTWSGTMSKKKGQKWGMNNSNKKSADIGHVGKVAGTNTEVNHLVLDSKNEENGFCGVSNQIVESSHDVLLREKTHAEEGKSISESMDFDSLYPLTRLPKEGDLIVYRLVELSSSWCPEISSYRVGKVLIYDLISMRIILLPVPEYPIIKEETAGEDESDMPVDMSPYSEDGSLEIEYSSLLDVRLLKGSESVSTAVSTPIRETGKKGESLVKQPVTLDKNKGVIHSQTEPLVPNNTKDPEAAQEKTKNKIWDESIESLSDKPDEVQENGWGTWKPNSSTSAWSYRAQRSTALGPTLALLRGKNGKGGKAKPPNRKYGK